jgi:tetratricopeptide (TPR) repeat protein
VGQGRIKEAISHYSEALRIKPDDAETHHYLGNALAKQGRIQEAIGHYAAAVRINPNDARAKRKLKALLVGN